MEKRELAVNLKREGHNCCQAVLAAYTDETGLPEETLDAMGVSFGGGMATMEATCGALCGAQMALGLMVSHGRPIPGMARTLLRDFESKAGALQCRQLKGLDTGKVLCPCDDCVRFAVDALQHVLEGLA